MAAQRESSKGNGRALPLTNQQQITKVRQRIQELSRRLRLSLDEALQEGLVPFTAFAQRDLERKRAEWQEELEDLAGVLRELYQEEEKKETVRLVNRATVDRQAVAAMEPRYQDKKSSEDLVYNVGMVTEAYLSPLRSFQRAFNLNSNNRPSKIASADELWAKSGGHKGLIQTFVPRDGLRDVSFDAFLPNDVKGSESKSRYGFQFHYNPGSIDMSYAGIPDIDVGYVASGNDPFNLVGTQVSQSSISFQLILNRVFDMQYYDPSGLLRSDAPPSVYSPSRPSEKDQKDIYNRGTMYDVEFFLSTILGFKAATQFRGDTADLGWIGGHPVELYLGKSLKYLAMTQGAALRHIIFNERMVPTFSTLSLTFNRIPDYASRKLLGTATGGITNRTPAAPAPPSGGGGGGGFLRPT